VLVDTGATYATLPRDVVEALGGEVTLEEFALGVDPIGKRLVPVTSYLCCA
jgi:hypothetical protein